MKHFLMPFCLQWLVTLNLVLLVSVKYTSTTVDSGAAIGVLWLEPVPRYYFITLSKSKIYEVILQILFSFQDISTFKLKKKKKHTDMNFLWTGLGDTQVGPILPFGLRLLKVINIWMLLPQPFPPQLSSIFFYYKNNLYFTFFILFNFFFIFCFNVSNHQSYFILTFLQFHLSHLLQTFEYLNIDIKG